MPEPLPDFEKAGDAELVRLLESPSQVRTLEAQRALLRRPGTTAMKQALLALAGNPAKPLPARVAALYALTQRAVKAGSAAPITAAVAPLAAEPALQRFVLRALGDAGLDGFSTGQTTAPESVYLAGLKSGDPRTRLEAIVGATRQNMRNLAPQIATQLGDADPLVAHTAFRALAMLKADAACFAVIDDASAARRRGALLALMRMHTPEVVRGLIARLEKTSEPVARAGLLAALCRLHFQEGEWKGDSWGTRPDTRGPYYQPDAWSETPAIAAVLKSELEKSAPAALTGLIRELRLNRIELNGSLQSIMALVKTNPALLPDLVTQLGDAETIPTEVIPDLLTAVNGDFPAETKARAVAILARTDSKEGCLASLGVLGKLEEMKITAAKSAVDGFLGSPKLENHHQLLEEQAARLNGTVSLWADAALLNLSARKTGSPESRELSKKDIDRGWGNPQRRVQILRAIQATRFQGLDEQVLAAMEDKDAAVASAAQETAKVLKLGKKGEDKSPLVSTLAPAEAIAAVMKTRSDIALGEQVFTRQSCATCHAANLDEPQKGPYLGNIAQGFATELFTLKDGGAQMAFVTFESAELVKARNIAGQEFAWKTADIVRRDKLPNSLMPPGLVNSLTIREFASLLDYLESLGKK